MSGQGQYKRVLIKLSGESLCAAAGSGIDPGAVSAVVAEVSSAVRLGVETAVVIGAGNIIRGRDLADQGVIDRPTADMMGMLATVINALALRDALAAAGMPAVVMSAMPMTGVCEPFVRLKAIEHLQAGRVVIFGGGTGHPFFTTDTCAALRALEIGAEALIKATKVDGVYDGDPVADAGAKKYESLTYEKVLADRLGVMDLAAVSMCMENDLPIIVLRLEQGSLAAAVRGEKTGTTICR